MQKSTVSKIHPKSLELCSKGHPWITKDEFSIEFDSNFEFLEIEELGTTFIHDFNHPLVKARRWGDSSMPFIMDLEDRLGRAILKRSKINDRDNIYLVFGEVDELPGLFIQKLKKSYLVQYQSFFWESRIEMIKDFLLRRFEGLENIYSQKRLPGIKKTSPHLIHGEKLELVISEFDISYKLKLDQNHDIGIYTDISSIRKKISTLFEKRKNVLNLFSYTGAFSLLSLKKGASVTSVDLSKKYMAWLEENIHLNSFNIDKHHSVVKPVQKYLENNTNQYDLIICDPPSFSSDGKKSQSAFDFYKKNFPLLKKAMTAKGELVIFLNTHKISRQKFKRLIPKYFIMKRELFMSKDCPLLKGFPEGDYLKGYILGLK